jgi:hypothetical protein
MTTKPTYEQLIVLLDACIPLLETAALREARKPPLASGLREASWKLRLKAARAYVAASGVKL